MARRWRPWQRREEPPPVEDEPLLAAPPMPDIDVIQRGDAATRLLGDPILAGAFNEIRHDAYRLWLATKPPERERREELYRIVQALELVRGKLRAYRGAAQLRRAEREDERRADAA